MGFTPSAGDELQSEYLVPRGQAVAALESLRALAGIVRPVLQVSELRTVAADRLWMSPQYGQDTLAVHFTWLPDRAGVERALVEVEAALAPFGARPHWGKLFLADAAAIVPLYPRLPDFAALVGRLDPHGVFANAWLRRHVLGGQGT
jgi:alditol oxidase